MMVMMMQIERSRWQGVGGGEDVEKGRGGEASESENFKAVMGAAAMEM